MPIGSVWASGSWLDGAWGDGTWADIGDAPCPAAPIGTAWAAGSWLDTAWCLDTWASAGTPPTPSAGNYVQRVIGRTTRVEDFARPKRVSRRKLREKIEEDYIIL